MNIAFLTPEYPHPKVLNSAGIGTSIKNLAHGLIAEGCKVHILVYGQKEDNFFIEDDIMIHQIKNIKLKGLSWLLTRKKIEKIINTLYKNQEIDLVEAPDWTGITSFIRPRKCPIIIRLHGSDTYFCHLDNRPVKWINKFHEKRALQNANAVISVSQFTADMTNNIFGLHKKFIIIPNGINTQTFINESNPLSLREGRRKVKGILYFGSLIRKKGLLELPFIFNEVIKTNPEVKLLLVGRDVPDIISGSPSTWYMMQQLFTSEALAQVTYMGSVPYEKIKQHIKEATVCVFPTFAEAMPVSWLEAMSMEKAIVASDIGWAKEIIDNGINGFLEYPKNHIEFAEKILQLLNNIIIQNKFGIAARNKVVDKFSIEVVARQSLTFYNNILVEN